MNKFFQSGQEYLRGLFLAIQEARKDIYFCAYAISYREQSPALSVHQVIEELCNASKRGVKVYGVVNTNLNLPYLSSQTQRAVESLWNSDCEIKLFPKSRILHAKLFVIDNCQVFIGSQNLTEAKEFGQIEASMMIEDCDIAGQIKSFISLLGTIQEEEVS